MQMGSLEGLLQFSLCRCCKAVELFAAACIRLGIPQHSQPVDPYTGEPVPDPNSNPYLAAVPQPLRRYLSGMLPGMHAMAATPFGQMWPGTVLQPRLDHDLPGLNIPLFMFFTSLVCEAVLKVCCAALRCALLCPAVPCPVPCAPCPVPCALCPVPCALCPVPPALPCSSLPCCALCCEAIMQASLFAA